MEEKIILFLSTSRKCISSVANNTFNLFFKWDKHKIAYFRDEWAIPVLVIFIFVYGVVKFIDVIK